MPASRASTQALRRHQLITAAVDAIQERGIGALRVQDVAERAGVSTGTVHYHFSDLDGLILEVFGWASERFFANRLASVAAIQNARAQLLDLVGSGLPSGPDDALVVALYDLATYFRLSQANSMLVQALFDRQVALYFSTLQLGVAQGSFRLRGTPLDLAHNLVALEDAYGLHIVTGNGSIPPARARGFILDYARTVTDCLDLHLPE